MKLKNHISVALCIMAVFVVFAHAQKDYEVKRAFPRDCGSGYSLTCFKLDIVQFIEKMAETKEYNLMPGVRIVRELRNSSKNSEIVAGKKDIRFDKLINIKRIVTHIRLAVNKNYLCEKIFTLCEKGFYCFCQIKFFREKITLS